MVLRVCAIALVCVGVLTELLVERGREGGKCRGRELHNKGVYVVL